MSTYWPVTKIFIPLAALLVAACSSPEDAVSLTDGASVSSEAIEEGNVGQTSLSFTVTSPVTQVIRYNTTSITAASGSDFQYTSGEWTIDPGSPRTVSVTVNGDLQIETDERVGLTLTYSDDSTSFHEAIILNDDRPSVAITGRSVLEGADSTSVVRFSLKLDQKTLTDFPVQVVSQSPSEAVIASELGAGFDPAVAGVDYQSVDQELVFPAGSTDISIDALILGDVTIENDEAFSLSVFDTGANPATDPALSSAYGVILNDDGPGFNMPNITLGTGTGTEGVAGASNTVDFTVSFSGPNDVDLPLYYDVILTTGDLVNGTRPANANDIGIPASPVKFIDILTSDSLPITHTISIPIVGDDEYEAAETFELIILTADEFELARSTGTIRNDDLPTFSLSQIVSDTDDTGTLEGPDGTETDMEFLLTLTEPEGLAQSTRLSYQTFDGFAEDDDIEDATGTDYRTTQEDLTFAISDSSAIITVPIIGDDDYEPDEAFTLQVSLNSAAVATAKGVIINDDQPGFIATLDGEEGKTVDEGTVGSLTFDAYFLEPVTRNTTVYYSINSGSADIGNSGDTDTDANTAGTVTLEGELFYEANSTTMTAASTPISIDLIDDALVEGAESFSISFYKTEGARDRVDTDGRLYQSITTIADDDFVEVSFSTTPLSVNEGTGDTNIQITDPILIVSRGVLENDTDVLVRLTSGTASSTDDFQAPTQITIAAGDYTTASSIAFPDLFLIPDNLLENNETIVIELLQTAPGSALQLGTPTEFEITITDDEAVVVALDESQIDVEEGQPVDIPITTSGAIIDADSPPVSFAFTVTRDAVTEAADYSFTNGTVTINQNDILTYPAGWLTLDEDGLVESTETLTIGLNSVGLSSRVSYADDTATTQLNILSMDEVTVSLPATDLSFNEGTSPNIPVNITGATRDDDSPALSFRFIVTQDAGTEAADYSFTDGAVTIEQNGSLTYPANRLTLVDDDLIENPETLTISLDEAGLSDFVSYEDPTATAELTIVNTDTITLTLDAIPNVNEGDTPTITLSASGGTLDGDSPTLTFKFTAMSGTAATPSDYLFTDGTATLTDSSGSFNYSAADVLSTVDDDVVEGSETLTLGLSEASPPALLSLSASTSTITIANDDVLTATFINNDSVDVQSGKVRYETDESSVVSATAVQVTGETDIAVTLEFEQVDREPYQATAGNDISLQDVDFQLASLTVPSTHTSGAVYDFPAVVQDTTDTTTEFNESFLVQLLAPAISDQPVESPSAGNGDAGAILIVNDDLTATLSGTGIDYCADENGAILADCTTAVPALQSQDGKLANTGFTSDSRAAEADSASTPLTWQCVRDQKTGKVWAYEVQANPATYNGSNSDISSKIAEMNGVCGNTDWRLPIFHELTNLMTFTADTELLDTTIEFDNVQVADSTDRYWFQMNNDGTVENRTFSFNQGQVTSDTNAMLLLVSDAGATSLVEVPPTASVYACAVAEETPPDSPDASIVSDHRFTVKDTEVTDNVTGLTWLARPLLTSASDASPTWGTALNQANTYLDGSWRAATIKELLSIVHLNCDFGANTDTNLPHFFLPRSTAGGVLFPLMSSSPVNTANEDVWAIDLTNDAALLSQSDLPDTVDMQTFLVKTP